MLVKMSVKVDGCGCLFWHYIIGLIKKGIEEGTRLLGCSREFGISSDVPMLHRGVEEAYEPFF